MLVGCRVRGSTAVWWDAWAETRNFPRTMRDLHPAASTISQHHTGIQNVVRCLQTLTGRDPRLQLVVVDTVVTQVHLDAHVVVQLVARDVRLFVRFPCK
jgi:hypothetical protein